MKRTTYRLLSVLLTAVLLLSMFPLTAFAATESYALYICGTQVTSDNASDVLGNGAFSYNSSTKTLTIRKSQTYSGQFLIRNALAGLKISVPANVTLTNTASGNASVMRLEKLTTTSGSGTLTLGGSSSAASMGIAVNNCVLNITNAKLYISDVAYGITGTGSAPLVIENSLVRVYAATQATRGTNSPYTLTNSSLYLPENGSVSDQGVVLDSDGNPAAEAWFVPSSFVTYDLRVGGTRVNMLNKSDVLGDGTVSFNSTTNTLTLSGEEIDTEEQYFIDSKINGLTVNASEDVSVFNYWNDSTLPSAAIRSEGDLTITGGKLILEGSFTENSVGIQMIGDRALTVRDADLTVRYFNFGMQGESASSAVLNVDSSYINLETDSPAVSVAVRDFKGGINFADGIDVIYPSMVTLDGGTIKNLDGSAAANVEIGSTSSFYGLSVAGIRVTESNKDDIPGNGVFSFDSETNTLTINKNYTTNFGQLIKNEIFGLTISVPNDVTITNGYGGEDGFELIYSTQSMTLTGGGRLFLFTQAVNGSAAFYMHSGRLTVLDATLAVSGFDYGILGNAAGANSLAVNNSEVRINSEEAAISDFRGGITLTDASVLYPSSGEISGGAVSWDSGVPVADVILGTKGSGMYSISVFGGGSVNSSDAGMSIKVYPYKLDGLFVKEYAAEGLPVMVKDYKDLGYDYFAFTMPDNNVKLKAVYESQQPHTFDFTKGSQNISYEEMLAITESLGKSVVSSNNSADYDINGDGINDIEIYNHGTSIRLRALDTYSVTEDTCTLEGLNITKYWPVSFYYPQDEHSNTVTGGHASVTSSKPGKTI